MWDFKNANFELYREKLSDFNWANYLIGDTINEICAKWSAKVLELAKESIPFKIVIIRPNDKPWYNAALRRLKRSKERLFRIFKQTNNNLNWCKFTTARNLYQAEVRKAKQDYANGKYKFLAEEGYRNPKKWWSLLKNVYKNGDVEDSIPPLEVDGELICNDSEKNQYLTTSLCKHRT